MVIGGNRWGNEGVTIQQRDGQKQQRGVVVIGDRVEEINGHVVIKMLK